MEEVFFCLHRAGTIGRVQREERSQVAAEELLNICVWLLLKCSPEIKANSNTTGPTAAFWANVPPTLAEGLHNNFFLKPSSSKHLASPIFLWMYFKVSSSARSTLDSFSISPFFVRKLLTNYISIFSCVVCPTVVEPSGPPSSGGGPHRSDVGMAQMRGLKNLSLPNLC